MIATVEFAADIGKGVSSSNTASYILRPSLMLVDAVVAAVMSRAV
jgi:hypothetical protein